MVFENAYKQLDVQEGGIILDQVSEGLLDVSFDLAHCTFLAIDLDFYPEYKLVEITDQSQHPAMKRVILYKPGSYKVLDYTNGPIYALNKELPIDLRKRNVRDYVRFFFEYVKGRHGRFLIVNSVEDIPWREDPPPAAREALGQMILPLELKKSDVKTTYVMTGSMIFKDALFRTDVKVEQNGQVTLFNEELLVEDIPVIDDVIKQ